jgi:hypothetical protein
MNYIDYYEECLRDGYDKAEMVARMHSFSCENLGVNNVDALASMVKEDLDKRKPEGIVTKCGLKLDNDDFRLELERLAIPNIKKMQEMMGCVFYVDKVYVYRNNYCSQPSSSWLWHYDNNPHAVLKMMVYLTDVPDKTYAPFTYAERIEQPSRLGTEKWGNAPNDSRVPESKIDKSSVYQVLGKKGTSFCFYPNCVHKATIPKNGKYRDVCVLRIRPWHCTLLPYISKKWTSSWERSGVVPKNPEVWR